jgi:hypothetical protein
MQGREIVSVLPWSRRLAAKNGTTDERSPQSLRYHMTSRVFDIAPLYAPSHGCGRTRHLKPMADRNYPVEENSDPLANSGPAVADKPV